MKRKAESEQQPGVDTPLPRQPSSRTLQSMSLGAIPAFRNHSCANFNNLTGDQQRSDMKCVQDEEPVQEDSFSVSIFSYHIARWVIGSILSLPFAILFATVIDSFTQMAADTLTVFLVALILSLTQQVFDALGRMLAEVSGRKSIGRAVCFGTIVSQMLVITGGFYRTVHPVISAVRKIRSMFIHWRV